MKSSSSENRATKARQALLHKAIGNAEPIRTYIGLTGAVRLHSERTAFEFRASPERDLKQVSHQDIRMITRLTILSFLLCGGAHAEIRLPDWSPVDLCSSEAITAKADCIAKQETARAHTAATWAKMTDHEREACLSYLDQSELPLSYTPLDQCVSSQRQQH
ncbi:MAG: hypothetical protein JSS20_16125 [Proteobacteria bacterium]|nr:hypothetical protein [Pseudomonadota bacterium]